MNIVFITPQIYPEYIGGAEIFNYYLINELNENGFKVDYVSYSDSKIAGAAHKGLKKFWPLRIFIPLQLLFHIIRLKSKVDIFHLSYMHSHWSHWFFYPILKYLFNIKYSITIHDPSLKEWGNKWIFRQVFNSASFIVGVSERLCEEYRSRCSNTNFHFLPPLIPIERVKETKQELRVKYNLSSNKFVFLFAGSLKESKKPITILRAINDLGIDFCEKHNLLFLFAGRGVHRNVMIDYIINNKLQEIAKMIGMLTQFELRRYYKLSDCYIIPSVFEGKSMSLIEAMSNGLAIIGSNAPGINDILIHNQNALLFEIDNHNELSERIEKITLDSQIRGRLSKNALSFYQNELQYDKMINSYKTLFSGE